MSYTETYKILNKLWLNTRDIQALIGCGKDSARRIRIEVANIIQNKGYNLPLGKNKIISSKEVIEYLGLDMNYIVKMACLEKQND